MSSALAIAGVTAMLRDLLNDGMIIHNVSGIVGNTVTVSALPPDRVVPANGTEATQLNLFLHQVTYNSGWRNHGLASRDGSGTQRLSNPPLALDLHYLLSAYSAVELGGEILLGHAMQLLHETPVLDRKAIKNVLDPSLPPPLGPLADCGLADQVEQIKITPEPLTTEELSKIWTAVQSHLRPTAAYLATVVLIESTKPTRPTLPVLSRGLVDPVTKRDQGVAVQADLLPPYPTIQMVRSKDGQPTAVPGATVEVTGHHLDGTGRAVVFSSALLNVKREVVAVPGNSPSELEVVVPTFLSVGLYKVAAKMTRPGESQPRLSNEQDLIIGPKITTVLPITVPRVSGNATVTLTCMPNVLAGQQVSLLLGSNIEVLPESWSAPASSFTFIAKKVPVGDYLVRLRVNGIDSPVIDFAAQPPAFFNFQMKIT